MSRSDVIQLKERNVGRISSKLLITFFGLAYE